MSDRDIQEKRRELASNPDPRAELELKYAELRAGLRQLGTVGADQAERAGATVLELRHLAEYIAGEAEATGEAGAALAGEIREAVEGVIAEAEAYPSEDGWYFTIDPLHLVPLRAHIKRAGRRKRAAASFPVTLEESARLVALPRLRVTDGAVTFIPLRRVRVRGELPDIGDWRMVARLHHYKTDDDTIATTIHRLRSAADIPAVNDETLAKYRAKGRACDECERNRRGKRAWMDTFIIWHPEHGTAQLGRTCLEAYTGASASLAMAVFDLHQSATAMLAEHGELDESELEAFGPAVLSVVAHVARRRRLGLGLAGAWSDAMSYGLGLPLPSVVMRAAQEVAERLGATVVDRNPESADIGQAEDVIALARAALLPALEAERAELRAREAGAEYTWPADVARLPERYHNLSAVLAGRSCAQAEAQWLVAIFDWAGEAERIAERAEADKRAREMAGDPLRAAAELADALRPLEAEAAGSLLARGIVALEPAALARLIVAVADGGNGQADAVRALITLAREVSTGEAAPLIPAHDGAMLAAVGAEGTWRLTLRRVSEWRRGGGWTVKAEHAGDDGRVRNVTMFCHSRPQAAELSAAIGSTLAISGTVSKRDTYRGAVSTVLDPWTIAEAGAEAA